MKTKGIHHISIISGDGQRNADFYVKSLGLRMVLKTVNQDDPSNYHLFYANGAGQPGSGITFFPWPMAVQAKYGTGEATAVSFSVPEGSFDFWIDRFAGLDIPFGTPSERFGRLVLPFKDPDGLPLELTEDARSDKVPPSTDSDIPEKFAIRGFWGTTLSLRGHATTAEILETVLGFSQTKTEANLVLFETGSPLGHSVIIETTGETKKGTTGRGTVHHVAFRAKDEEELASMRKQVTGLGLAPTEIIDRHVFKSVYFQTPGGVLFEMATDGPGYASVANKDAGMGRELFLPPWLESKRDFIEKRLPPISV